MFLMLDTPSALNALNEPIRSNYVEPVWDHRLPEAVGALMGFVFSCQTVRSSWRAEGICGFLSVVKTVGALKGFAVSFQWSKQLVH